MAIEFQNVRVYGLGESMRRAQHSRLVGDISMEDLGSDNDIRLARRLGNRPIGSGHAQYLVGITVQCDLRAPEYWWMHAGRYHWWQTVSSQSKMYSLAKMDLDDLMGPYIDHVILERLKVIQESYRATESKDVWLTLLASTGLGYERTAAITSNYMQIKNMASQRRRHRLPEWLAFYEWAHTLPMFTELTGLPI